MQKSNKQLDRGTNSLYSLTQTDISLLPNTPDFDDQQKNKHLKNISSTDKKQEIHNECGVEVCLELKAKYCEALAPSWIALTRTTISLCSMFKLCFILTFCMNDDKVNLDNCTVAGQIINQCLWWKSSG